MSAMSARRGRILRVAAVFVALFALLFLRAVDLTVLRGPDFARRATRQHRQTVTLVPQRGPILDRNGALLASSVNVPSVFMRPRQLTAADLTKLPQLAKALGVPLVRLRAAVNGTQKYVWLKRHALPQQAEAAAVLGMTGVGEVDEPRRFYPHGELAAHVLGFVNVDSQGLAGLERRLDKQIRGESQEVEVARDAHGRVFHKAAFDMKPLEGARIEVTLDAHVQQVTERELAAGVQAAKARAGAAIVLNPTTGEILALANYPTFNPNDPTDRSGPSGRTAPGTGSSPSRTSRARRSRASSPPSRSTAGVVRPGDRMFCENGNYRYANRVIHDVHGHGWLTMAEAIQYSSNICATKIATVSARSATTRGCASSASAERSGVELPGREPGILRNVATWARIDLATHSFGQGVSVTPLQLAAAFGAIANGGVLMHPYLVRRIESPTGELRSRDGTDAGPPGHQARGGARRDRGSSPRRRGEGRHRDQGADRGLPRCREDRNGAEGDPGCARIFRQIHRLVRGLPPGGCAARGDPRHDRRAGGTRVRRHRRGSRLPEGRPRRDEGDGRRARDAGRRRPAARRASARADRRDRRRDARDRGAPDGTPSFLGLSMREAMARAYQEGFDVHRNGSGWVSRRIRAPDAPLRRPPLALEFRPDRGVAVP
jgi:cell division protein FtsI/penicillin-binding protein 2